MIERRIKINGRPFRIFGGLAALYVFPEIALSNAEEWRLRRRLQGVRVRRKLSARIARIATVAAGSARRVALLVLLVVGCYNGPHPGDTLTPVGPDGWAFSVQEAADVWAAALGPECPRYEVAKPGHAGDWDVRLVAPEEWTWGESYVGWYEPGNGIDIRGTTPDRKLAILLHELGHGIFGREHSADRTSVMYPSPMVLEPSPDDIAAARAALGCE